MKIHVDKQNAKCLIVTFTTPNQHQVEVQLETLEQVAELIDELDRKFEEE